MMSSGKANPSRHVVAIGGHSAKFKGKLAPLHRYALGLTDKAKPRVCYIPTACGDSAEMIANFYAGFTPDICEPSHLPLFQNTVEDIPAFLAAQDLIYVGGGNTRNMLTLWRLWGVDTSIRAAWERGTVLAGVSAGGLCWFGNGITDSYAGDVRALPCLGWIPGSFCPHYDSEPGRPPVLERLVAGGDLPDGYAVEDDAAVHFCDGKLIAAVAQVPGKSAYAFARVNGAAKLERLQAVAVGDGEDTQA
jgi:peptidase E